MSLFLTPAFASQALADTDGLLAAEAVIDRFTDGTYKPLLRLSLQKTVEGHDQYIINKVNGQLLIEGSSPVALCHAFYTWTRRCGAGMMTWSGKRFEASRMRLPEQPVAVVSPYRDHQYLNVVTFGYTTAYWDEDRWDREVDYMALHGIDMPLSLMGQEAVQRVVFRKLGLTDKEIAAWETGPAHLPWMRMGNVAGNSMDGPLSEAWLEKQVSIEKHLLKRYRALGMKPIVPAFSGFVPAAFGKKYGQAVEVGWGWVSATSDMHNYRLMPGSSQFVKLGKLFVETWDSIFGPARYYLSDSFNEMTIPTDKALLTAYGDSIYKSIITANPEAVWVMQGWTLGYQRKEWKDGRFEALIKHVPDDRFMLLDMATDYNRYIWKNGYNWDTFPRFYGKQWAWSVIPDMGGRTQPTGHIDFYANGRLEALRSDNRGQLTGYGIAPEGIENNELLYELITDGGWTDRPIDLDQWLTDYAEARYGFHTPTILSYFDALRKSVYGEFHGYPSFNFQTAGKTKRGSTGINAAFRLSVRKLLQEADSRYAASPLLIEDMAEAVALCLGNDADSLTWQFDQLVKAGKKDEARRLVPVVSTLLTAADSALALHPSFSLNAWQQKAWQWGCNAAESRLFTRNARRLLTTWIDRNPQGRNPLDDYANRFWNGLVKDYYLPRLQNSMKLRLGLKAMPEGKLERQWVNDVPKTCPQLPAQPSDKLTLLRRLLARCL